MADLEFEELCAHIEDEMRPAGSAADNTGTDKVSFASFVGSHPNFSSYLSEMCNTPSYSSLSGNRGVKANSGGPNAIIKPLSSFCISLTCDV